MPSSPAEAGETARLMLGSASNTSRSSVKGLAKATTFVSQGATPLLSPPTQSSPQVTTVPSALRAAKAKPVEKICVTPELSWPATPLLSLPELVPQVTTEPSALRAAKASNVENICVTPELSWPATPLLSPPLKLSPQVTTEPSPLRAANA